MMDVEAVSQAVQRPPAEIVATVQSDVTNTQSPLTILYPPIQSVHELSVTPSLVLH